MENTINIPEITIPGLDWNKGVEQVNGKKDDYLKVLRSYMTGTRTKLALLENVSKDNLKQYEINVHGIKGSSYLICAQGIGSQAADLEKAAVAGDLDFINQHNPKLLKDAWEFVHSLEEIFNKMDAEKIRPKKDKPDIEALKKLAAACDIYDMLEVEAAITEITAYEYDSDDGLADWLQHSAEEMQYEQIVEKLSSII